MNNTIFTYRMDEPINIVEKTIDLPKSPSGTQTDDLVAARSEIPPIKNFWKFLIVVLSIVYLGINIVRYYEIINKLNQKKSNNVKIPVTYNLLTNTYQDESGFSIQYPSNWSIPKSETYHLQLVKLNPKIALDRDKTAIHISISDRDPNFQSCPNAYDETIPITIDGHELIYTILKAGQWQSGAVLDEKSKEKCLFIIDNKYYVISTGSFENNSQEIIKILSTIKFPKSDEASLSNSLKQEAPIEDPSISVQP
jgi:hypothetical protein